LVVGLVVVSEVISDFFSVKDFLIRKTNN
jgi:hypothetical protein